MKDLPWCYTMRQTYLQLLKQIKITWLCSKFDFWSDSVALGQLCIYCMNWKICKVSYSYKSWKETKDLCVCVCICVVIHFLWSYSPTVICYHSVYNLVWNSVIKVQWYHTLAHTSFLCLCFTEFYSRLFLNYLSVEIQWSFCRSGFELISVEISFCGERWHSPQKAETKIRPYVKLYCGYDSSWLHCIKAKSRLMIQFLWC